MSDINEEAGLWTQAEGTVTPTDPILDTSLEAGDVDFSHPNEVDVGTNSYTDRGVKDRIARTGAVFKMLNDLDPATLDETEAQAYFTEFSSTLFHGVPDRDGLFTFGKSSTGIDNLTKLKEWAQDPKGHAPMSEELKQWKEMSEEEQYRFALEHESIRQKARDDIEGKRGSAFWATIKGLAAHNQRSNPLSNIPVIKDQIEKPLEEIEASASEDARKVREENLTPEELKERKELVRSEYENRLLRRSRAYAMMQSFAGLSPYSRILVANAVNTGDLPYEAFQNVPDREKEAVLAAVPIVRGNLRTGRVLGIPVNFEDGNGFGNVTQLSVYEAQKAIIDSVKGLGNMVVPPVKAVWRYATVHDAEKRREMSMEDTRRRKVEIALEQQLPESNSNVAEGVRAISRMAGFAVAEAVMAKGAKIAAKGAGMVRSAKEATETALGIKKGLQAAKMTEDIEGQLMVLEASFQAIDKARRTGRMIQAGGQAVRGTGYLMFHADMAKQFMDGCCARNIPYDYAAAAMLPAVIIQGRIEKAQYIQMSGADINPVAVRALGYRAMAEAMKTGRFRQWLALFAKTGTATALETSLEEACEDTVQELTGGVWEKWADVASRQGICSKEAFMSLIPDRETIQNSAMSVVEGMPAYVAFGITPIPFAQIRQNMYNFSVHMKGTTFDHDGDYQVISDWLASNADKEVGKNSPTVKSVIRTARECLLDSRGAVGAVETLVEKGGMSVDVAQSAVRIAMDEAQTARFDLGTATMTAEALKNKEVISDYLNGDDHAENLTEQQVIESARDCLSKADAVGELMDRHGLTQEVAEAAVSIARNEFVLGRFSRETRASVERATGYYWGSDLREDAIRDSFQGYVNGSYNMSADRNTVTFKIRVQDPDAKTGETTKTISVKRVEQVVLPEEVEEEDLADDSPAASSYNAGVAPGQKTWQELSETERRNILASRVNGISLGKQTVAIEDEKGHKISVPVDSLIRISDRAYRGEGYWRQSTDSVLRHETFHSLYRFARESGVLTKEKQLQLARTMGVDTSKARWDVDLDEELAVHFEKYELVRDYYMPEEIEQSVTLLHGWLAKLGDKLSSRSRGKAGRTFDADQFLERISTGRIGDASAGISFVKQGKAKTPQAEPVSEADNRTKTDIDAPKTEVKTETKTAPVEEKPKPEETPKAEEKPEETGKVETPKAEDKPKEDPIKWNAKTPDGKVKLSGTVKFVEADDLVTSYDSNPAYDQRLQEKDSTSHDSKTNIMAIENELDPDMLTDSEYIDRGSPMVTKQNNCISGNTRGAAIKQAYRDGKADAYRQKMQEEAQKRGVDISGMRNPVMVRELDSVDGAKDVYEVARMSNRAVTRNLTESEQAGSDAEILNNLNLLQGIETRKDGTVDEKASAEALAQFIAATGAQGMVDDAGILTETGRRRIRNALLASAFGTLGERGKQLVNTLITQSGRLDMEAELDALTANALKIAQIAKEKPEYDMTGKLAEAMEIYVGWRNANAIRREKQGKTLSAYEDIPWKEYTAQRDLFGEPDPTALNIAGVFARSRIGRTYNASGELSIAARERTVRSVDGFFSDVLRNVDAIDTKTEKLFKDIPDPTVDEIVDKMSKRYSVGPVWSGSGTPYDKPSMLAIGSGENAFVYGYGLYSSKSRDVAKWYADKQLKNPEGLTVRYDGRDIYSLDESMRKTLEGVKSELYNAISGGEDVVSPKDALKKVIQTREDLRDEYAHTIEVFEKSMERTPKKIAREEKNGNFDQVEMLKAKLESLPGRIEQEKQSLRNIERDLENLRKIDASKLDVSGRKTPAIQQQTWWTNRPEGDESHLLDWDSLITDEQRKWIQDTIKSDFNVMKALSGHGIASYLFDKNNKAKGRVVYEDLSEAFNSQKKASEFLYRAGIDGIKYIGETSGEVDYVAFDDKYLRVDHREDYNPETGNYEKRYSIGMGSGYIYDRNGMPVMSVNASDALQRGALTANDIAKTADVPIRLVEAFPYPEWHHTGADFFPEGFYPRSLMDSPLFVFAKKVYEKAGDEALDKVVHGIRILTGLSKRSYQARKGDFSLEVGKDPEVIKAKERYQADAEKAKTEKNKEVSGLRREYSDLEEKRKELKSQGIVYPDKRYTDISKKQKEVQAKIVDAGKILKHLNSGVWYGLESGTKYRDLLASKTSESEFDKWMDSQNRTREERAMKLLSEVEKETGIEIEFPAESEMEQRYSVTREQDQAYLDAVKRGDMETAQKMVDEVAKKNGYTPVLRFHQTERVFSKFSTANPKAGKNDSETPNGIFVKTNDHDIGLGGNIQMRLYLQDGKYLYFADRKQANKWYRSHIDGYAELDIEMNNRIKVLEKKDDELDAEMYPDDGNISDEKYDKLYEEQEKNLKKMWEVDTEYRSKMRSLLDDYFLGGRSGYDGIELAYDGSRRINGKIENVHTFIVFHGSQLKSADPVTYDDNGEVIPLSKRFDSTQDDIRYSVSQPVDESKYAISSDAPTSFNELAITDPNAIDLARFNIATEPYVQEKLRAFTSTKEAKGLNLTPERMEKVIKDSEQIIQDLNAIMSGDPNYDAWKDTEPTVSLDWRDGEWHFSQSWVRGNIEYKYDMSADTLCINNEGLETVFATPMMADIMVHIAKFSPKNKNLKKKDRGFTSDDYLRLYETLRDNGFVVPCKGCFDAAMRMKMLPPVAQKFAKLVNSTINKRNKDPESFDQALRDWAKENGKETDINGLPLKAKNKDMAVAIGVAGDRLTEHVDWTQLISAEGQTKALADWGGIFRAWQRTGAGRPKDKLLPEPYTAVMVDSQATIIAPYGAKTPSFRAMEVNQGTSLRRNSHSELRPILIIDEVQFMREAYLKDLMVFKYMKELDDVRLFGKMGVKYNMSAFPAYVPGCVAAGLDADGNYIMAEESVGGREFEYTGEDGKKHYDGNKGLEEAKTYINEDCSLSSVVFSIPHLIKCFTDVPTPKDKRGQWGSLIPFHNSGSTAEALKKQGLGEERASTPKKSFDKEAMTKYDVGVTNFEQVQNDRFGEGWVIVAGKKKGTKVECGHKIEFANGTDYYNKKKGIHLHSSYYTLDKENNEVKHPFSVDYNDKVRELRGDYAYKDASDYYIKFLKDLGLVPRFDFTVPESTYLEMCEKIHVDPKHPKLGWKGRGHDWSPIDSDAYYSTFCDYGMTDPKTGRWAEQRAVGVINRKTGEREFKLPGNAAEIAKKGLERYTQRKSFEDSHIYDVIAEYCRRTIADGKADPETIRAIMKENGASQEQIDIAMGKKELRLSISGATETIGMLGALANSPLLNRDLGNINSADYRQMNRTLADRRDDRRAEDPYHRLSIAPGPWVDSKEMARAQKDLMVLAYAGKMASARKSTVGTGYSTDIVAGKLQKLFPNMSKQEANREASLILKRATTMAKEIRSQIGDNATNEQLYNALSYAQQQMYDKSMTRAGAEGIRTGMKTVEAEQKLENIRQRKLSQSIAAVAGLDADDMEKTLGVDLVQTITYLSQMPKKEEGEEKKEGEEEKKEGETTEESPDAEATPEPPKEATPELEARMRELIEDIRNRSFAKTQKDMAEAEARRQERKKKREEQEANGGTEADDVNTEAEESNLTPEEAALVIRDRLAVDLNNPEQFSRFVEILCAMSWYRQHPTDKPDLMPWSDPLALQYFRKTAISVYRKLNKALVYSRSRSTVDTVLHEMQTAPSAESLLRKMDLAGHIIQNQKIRETQKQLIERLDKFLKDRFGASGQFSQKKEDINRKVTAETELWARDVRKVIHYGSEKTAKLMVETQAKLEGAHERFDKAGYDYNESLEYANAVRLMRALNEYGGLREKSPGEIEDAINQVENVLYNDKVADIIAEREERTERVSNALATAFDNGNTQIPDPNKRKADRYVTEHLDFKNLLLDLTRGCKNEKARAVAENVIDILQDEVQLAHDRTETEKRRNVFEFRKALESIYGKPYGKVLKELFKPDKRFDKFGTLGDTGSSVAMNRAQAMQLYASLLQTQYDRNAKANKREGQKGQLELLLSPQDLRLIAWMRDWYDRGRQSLSDVSMAVVGTPVLSESENYMPVKVYLPQQGLEKPTGQVFTPFPPALTRRVPNNRDFDVRVDIVSMWMSKMSEQAQWKNHALLGVELRGIFGRQNLQSVITRSHGEYATRHVKEFITDILIGGYTDSSARGMKPAIDEIRGYCALMALGGNFGVTLKQTTSIPAFGFEIGLVDTAKYIATCVTPEGIQAMKELWNSDQRKNRWDSGNSEAVVNALSDNNPNAMKKVLMASMITNKMGDIVPSLVVGQGVYRDLLRQGWTAERAMNRTWEIINRTQQTSQQDNLSSLQRRSAWGRAFYQFMSTQRQYLAYEVTALRAVLAQPKSKRAWRKAASTLLLNHVVLPALYNGMGMLWNALLGKGPSEEWKMQMLISCMMGPFSSLLVIGFMSQVAVTKLLTGDTDEYASMLPSEEFARKQASDIFAMARDVLLMPQDDVTMDDLMDDFVKWAKDTNPTFRDIKKVYDNRIKK